jgi:plastocyanin
MAGLACVFAAAARPATAADAAIDIVDFDYEPSELTVEPETVVRWTNTGAQVHTVTSDSGAFLSEEIAPGGTYEHRFDRAGEFGFHCSIHESMRGMITVQRAAATTTSTGVVTTVTTVATPEDLAHTGPSRMWISLVGIAMVFCGAVVLGVRRRRPAFARVETRLDSRPMLPEEWYWALGGPSRATGRPGRDRVRYSLSRATRARRRFRGGTSLRSSVWPGERASRRR